MTLFEEREGFVPPRAFQVDSLDEATRMDIWNATHKALESIRERIVPNPYRSRNGSQVQNDVYVGIATSILRWARDDYKGHLGFLPAVRKGIQQDEWWQALGLVERVGRYLDGTPVPELKTIAKEYWRDLNDIFEAERVPYRAIDQTIVPVSTKAEAEAVEQALLDAQPFAGVRRHLDDAVERLSRKPDPDFAGSITGAISAVEGVVRAVTDARTLSDGLKALEQRGITLHRGLKRGLDALYGYTSDEKGLRHGSIEVSDADRATATLMLVTCSAFVSWFIDEGRKAGLLDAS